MFSLDPRARVTSRFNSATIRRSGSFRPLLAVTAAGPPAFLCCLLALGTLPYGAEAQVGFTEFTLTDPDLNSSSGTDFWIASAAPADADADGDLDLLIAGYFVVYPNVENPDGSVEERLTFYRNDGPAGTEWALTPIPVDAGDLTFGSADLAWGDYDGDGDPDVLVAGNGAVRLYQNVGGVLTSTGTELPDYHEDSDFSTMDLHSVSWADYDNDGDLDILLPSVIAEWSYTPTKVLRNEGPGSGDAWIFTDVSAGLPIAPNAVSAWADMEGDGDLDLLIANISPYGDNLLDTYRNDDGTLVAADQGLAFIRYGTTDWGDADDDGDLDIVYAGNIDLENGTGETVVRILFKEDQGGYTPVTVVRDFQSPEEPWLDFNAVTWADYDSDGDVDLLVTGEWLGDGEIFGRSLVYVNTAGTFQAAGDPLPAPIAGNAGGAFAWFDVDSDGDLDYFVAGAYYVPDGNGLVEARTQLFRNDAQAANAPPSVPENLRVNLDGGAVTLAWDPATDDATPQPTLTYEIEIVGSGPPMAFERALPEPGNISRNTSWTIQGLSPGVYWWTVRSLDSAFNASSPAQGTFQAGTASVASDPSAPRAPALSAAYPNPSRPSTTVRFQLPSAWAVSLDVFDVSGRLVKTLVRGPRAAGTHHMTWDGRDQAGQPAASGVYLLRLETPQGILSERVTLLR
jgi:FlgD Ig-like domain/FG-GAP-like repeat